MRMTTTHAKHVYTRTHQAHAWTFERTVLNAVAELERDVNKGFGIETLLVPAVTNTIPRWLDGCQSQSDFD